MIVIRLFDKITFYGILLTMEKNLLSGQKRISFVFKSFMYPLRYPNESNKSLIPIISFIVHISLFL